VLVLRKKAAAGFVFASLGILQTIPSIAVWRLCQRSFRVARRDDPGDRLGKVAALIGGGGLAHSSFKALDNMPSILSW
jgi:hypothetical protein